MVCGIRTNYAGLDPKTQLGIISNGTNHSELHHQTPVLLKRNFEKFQNEGLQDQKGVDPNYRYRDCG